MSRIGKKPIPVGSLKPQMRDRQLRIEGPKGKLSLDVPETVQVDIKEDAISVASLEKDQSRGKAIRGLYRALIQNMVTGVTQGYEKRLEINGVGFRARLEGRNLVLSLGYSHPINFPLPEGVSAKIENKDTLIILNGIDKQLIGNVAATIRRYYPPEPYKGKGVKYVDEVIRRKKGKRVA